MQTRVCRCRPAEAHLNSDSDRGGKDNELVRQTEPLRSFVQ